MTYNKLGKNLENSAHTHGLIPREIVRALSVLIRLHPSWQMTCQLVLFLFRLYSIVQKEGWWYDEFRNLLNPCKGGSAKGPRPGPSFGCVGHATTPATTIATTTTPTTISSALPLRCTLTCDDDSDGSVGVCAAAGADDTHVPASVFQTCFR